MPVACLRPDARGGRRQRFRSAARFRLDAHPVVDSVAKFLLASEVPLGGLDGDMAKQKLDLIQFTAGEMAEPRAGAPKIVRSKSLMPAREAASLRPPIAPSESFRCPDWTGLVD